MHALAILLLSTAVSIPQPIVTTTLILRDGARFVVDGPIREEHGRIIFRSGILYSIPIDDVDMDATRAAVTTPITANYDSSRKLRVSAAERDRLLRELEQNHSGTPSSEKFEKVAEPREAPDKGDEWSWRTAARAHEETIRRAKENVELLQTRAETLKRQIEQFVSLGYRPNQFSYQSTELQLTRDQLPAAELEVTRAERAYAQFREDARKQGILPGWLR
ncbi:MAG: hypothetical protein QOE82_2844 [Thermoanaerobaculia bacterium]|jgi:hypothetical protein|nr:hypothetical protein [Thermoanaerobaculia bacterium]